jgi:hypothetical protein
MPESGWASTRRTARLPCPAAGWGRPRQLGRPRETRWSPGPGAGRPGRPTFS